MAAHSRVVHLELPYPPSVNHYWRHVGHRTLISKKGRDYRRKVKDILRVLDIPKLVGPITATVHFYVPDRRKRDLDNMPKAVLDALEAAGAFENDSQIEELNLFKQPMVRGGHVSVILRGA